MTRQISTEASAPRCHFPTSRALGRSTLTLLCALTVSACSALYFHDDEYEKQAKSAADLVKTIDAAPQIEAWGTTLDELQKQSELTFAEELLSTRNTEIALILKGDPLGLGLAQFANGENSTTGGIALLDQQVATRFETRTAWSIRGAWSAETEQKIMFWANAVNTLKTALTRMDNLGNSLIGWRTSYKLVTKGEAKKIDLSCSAVHDPQPNEPQLGEAGGGELALIKNTCKNLPTEVVKIQADLPAELRPILQLRLPVTLGQARMTPANNPCDKIENADQRLIDILQKFNLPTPGTPEFKKESGDFNLENINTLVLSVSSPDEDNAQACLKKISEAMADLEPKKPDESKAPDVSEKLAQINDWLSKAAPSVELAALDDMIATLDALVKADLGRVADPESDTNQAGNPDCAKKADAATDGAKEAVAESKAIVDPCLINAIVTFADRGRTLLHSVNDQQAKDRLPTLLAALISLKQRKAIAEISLRTERAIRQTHELELMAAITETSTLARSALALKEYHTQMDALPTDGLLSAKPQNRRDKLAYALSAYATSWEVGRVPASLLNVRPNWLQQQDLLAKNVANAKASKDLINQATAAIADYAAGGIKLEDVLKLLVSLGIIGALAA